jgi:hypothetical protein
MAGFAGGWMADCVGGWMADCVGGWMADCVGGINDVAPQHNTGKVCRSMHYLPGNDCRYCLVKRTAYDFMRVSGQCFAGTDSA